MRKEQIPDEIRRFVLTSIPSIPFLEALLLLHSSPPRGWSARDIARRLYLPESTARGLLASLSESGFAIAVDDDTGSVRFTPDPQLSQRVTQLEHWYSVQLVELTSLIHTKVDKRAQQFADAFRWKKET